MVNYFKKIYIYVYSPQSFKKRNDERIKTAAGNREDVKQMNEKLRKAQKKAKEKEEMEREKEEERLKEEEKKRRQWIGKKGYCGGGARMQMGR